MGETKCIFIKYRGLNYGFLTLRNVRHLRQRGKVRHWIMLSGSIVSKGVHLSKKKSIQIISPLFNQVGKLRTSSHLQLRPGQDKAKQFDTYNDTELHME